MIFAFALDHQVIRTNRGRMYNEIIAPINLLLVCRQIHAETALLPYALNMFCVFDPLLPDMELRVTWNCCRLHKFLKRRTPAQIGAMANVMKVYGMRRALKSATERMETEHDAFTEDLMRF